MGDPVVLHPQLGPLGGLLGTWEGKGAGSYPTIEPFRYHERVEFSHVGKPFLTYQQKTWDEDNGAPLHAEVGYLRVVAAAVAVPAPDSGSAGSETLEGSSGGTSPEDSDAWKNTPASPALTATPLRLEFVLAHPTGIAEVEEGSLADGVLRLESTTVGRSATAKPVYSLRRELRIDGDELRYDLWMAHADTPETHHLHAVLGRSA
jgi:hypothetical protein